MSTQKREILFRVTAADCDWQYMASGGKGGQNVNKRATKVRCTHRESGAVGVAQDHREQRRNKELAFVRMAETPAFKAWWKVKCARLRGVEIAAAEAVERAMRPHNITTEVKEDGKWRPARPEDFIEEDSQNYRR